MNNIMLNEDALVYSDGYAETMNGFILPALQKVRKDLTVTGWEEKPLFCSRYDAENPRGTVMMLHGFTECGDKFSELIYSLLRNRWSVVTYDQRGHGRSWRDTSLRDASLVHVNKFSDYIHDLEAVCTQVLSGMPKPWMIFAHSMGGAVTAGYLELHNGETFEKAALCAPMIACSRGGIPYSVSIMVMGGARTVGKSKNRIFTSKPYAGKTEQFEASNCTSRERFEWYEDFRAAREELHTNGPSYQWTLNALTVTRRLLRRGEPEKITIPVRLYTAENDQSVLPNAQKKFISRVKYGIRKDVPGSRHEIYRSADQVLFPWWHEILTFFAEGPEA